MTELYIKFYQLPEGEKQFYYEHNLGRELLCHGLTELYDLPFTPDKLEEQIIREEHGKPYLKDHPEIFYNVSHCDGLVLCAFSDNAVGVDAEPIRAFVESILRRLFTPEEREFFDQFQDAEELRLKWFCRFWTLKESFLKQSGDGLYRELNSFSFTFDESTDPLTISCSDPDVALTQLEIRNPLTGNLHIISVCTTSASELRLHDLTQYT